MRIAGSVDPLQLAPVRRRLRCVGVGLDRLVWV